jgi:hypothetical protein
VAALQLLLSELAVTVGNPAVWLSIGLALALGSAILAFGMWVARVIGLVRADAPAGELLGVGLASGLTVFAAWWAAVWSGGRSSFTPVAVGFAIAIGLGVLRRIRGRQDRPIGSSDPSPPTTSRATWHRLPMVKALLGAALFVATIAILYGSTMVPSPRDGVQPVEFVDEAFYAVLGRDLGTTGTETNLSPSGFTDLPNLPTQTWYHWGELWLASAVISVFGATPMAARYFIVLPLVLLATAALSATVTRRVTGSRSTGTYLLGFLTCLFLAPVPLIPGPFFSSWAVGMIFGITLYGLGAVAVLLAIAIAWAVRGTAVSSALATFAGSAFASILPAHVALAVLSVVGLAGVWGLSAIRSLALSRRLPGVEPGWQRTLVVTCLVVVATLAWGRLMGHGLGGSTTGAQAAPIVAPFNGSWRESILITALGAGVFLAIPVAWLLKRRHDRWEAGLHLGTMGIVAAGALGWGARLGDFTMFYLFFGGLAIFSTVAAAVAVRTVWGHLRTTRRPWLAVTLVAALAIQLELGAVNTTLRLQLFGPNTYPAIPVSLLDAIRALPEGAKLAYACQPLEEVGFATPRLVSIDAHTGRRVVPICFQAETLSALLGAEPSERVENLFFRSAPQRELFPSVDARPSPDAIAAFLRRHGIDFLLTDPRHPNTLVPDAVPVAAAGAVEVLRLP